MGCSAASRAGHVLAIVAPLAFLGAQPARSHPHVWIETHVTLHFDSAQRLTAVVEEWVFDDLYTAFVVNDLKKKKDGSVPSSELQPLANQNVADLKEWGYFTVFKADGIRQTLGPATEPRMSYDKSRLTLEFTLPLPKPLDLHGADIAFSIFDPTFYIEIVPSKANPVVFENAPQGCSAKVRPLDTTQQRFIPDTLAFSIDTDPKSPENSVGAKFAEWVDLICTKPS
jgi:ABC-type uncharacterized transport system substrate-binding protein